MRRGEKAQGGEKTEGRVKRVAKFNKVEKPQSTSHASHTKVIGVKATLVILA